MYVFHLRRAESTVFMFCPHGGIRIFFFPAFRLRAVSLLCCRLAAVLLLLLRSAPAVPLLRVCSHRGAFAVVPRRRASALAVCSLL